MAQITNPSRAPNFLRKQNTKSLNQNIFPGLLTASYNILDLLVLGPYYHENKTFVSGTPKMTGAESKGLLQSNALTMMLGSTGP